jgi:hypothetical protein
MKSLKINGLLSSLHSNAVLVMASMNLIQQGLEHGIVCSHEVEVSLWIDVGDFIQDNLHTFLSRALSLDTQLGELW